MDKSAVLFPGQGVQTVGMGRDIYEAFPEAREILDQANDILETDLKTLMFDGPMEKLTETGNAQPAILTVNYAFFRLAVAKSIAFQGTAGHSLGEYNALVAAGALSFPDALLAVRERGRLMQEVGAKTEGTMAAILGLEEEKLKDVCLRASATGPVAIANFNCPGQLVISGEVSALEEACALAKEAGAKRAIRLQVGGAFHSSLLQEASEMFSRYLEGVKIDRPSCDFYTNVTGGQVSDPAEIRTLLARQLSSPVLWEKIIREMVRQGYGSFTEIGPGRVLTGLISQIDRGINTSNINRPSSIDALS
jgi:[acyl-carrier-protein] S-malonyltransferase